ncbi:hypothetical protein SYNPS1DRAFT_29588 [Syncephalis pseudoplumigaleata]|uniref:SUI1 domain-containing protein n=1 Tax=Syncephalis pseudoplumigaleata TaxID=1712513 RepID=A0A4P9YX60_9FUNG|nr:hypothetical protein SYNPS1DRAFT_29588 [Syncephalis pseudoplumigaleata]|eukprot:RKP24656.1 hypothetical protein SYNPS1DRAFT_29588 [Syncephalis pseudoplumigaleata]
MSCLSLIHGQHHVMCCVLCEALTAASTTDIRVKQRNGRKCVTSIEGLDLVLKDVIIAENRLKNKGKEGKEERDGDELFLRWLKKIKSELMQELSVGGGKVNADKNGAPVIQFQGNKAYEAVDFLLGLKFRHTKSKIERSQIEIHDF